MYCWWHHCVLDSVVHNLYIIIPKGNHLPRKNECALIFTFQAFTDMFTFMFPMNFCLRYCVPSHIIILLYFGLLRLLGMSLIFYGSNLFSLQLAEMEVQLQRSLLPTHPNLPPLQTTHLLTGQNFQITIRVDWLECLWILRRYFHAPLVNNIQSAVHLLMKKMISRMEEP